MGFIKIPKVYAILCCFSAVLACQRYLFDLHLYACAIPLFLSIFYFRKTELRNSFLIIALFLCVDNGDQFTSLTHSLVRYPIYLAAFFALLYDQIYNVKRILIFLAVLIIPLTLTLLNLGGIDYQILIRDLEFTLIIAAIVCKSTNGNNFPLDIRLISIVLLFFICAELINVITQNAFSSQRYLNYSSSKSLIVLPAFYFIRNNKVIPFIIVFLITAVVLIPYGTRMIILTFILITIVGIFRARWVKPIFLLGFLVLVTITTAILQTYNIELEGFKATGVFIQLIGEGNIFEKIRLIDPIRYTETQLFFDRNFFRVLIGDGFGAGIKDIGNELYFVTENDTAFSTKELSSRIFYNLHDTWIDLGLRFGLFFILLIYYIILKGVVSKSRDKAFYAKTLFVLFSCATYSFQGLLIIAFLWQHFILLDNNKDQLQSKNKLVLV